MNIPQNCINKRIIRNDLLETRIFLYSMFKAENIQHYVT